MSEQRACLESTLSALTLPKPSDVLNTFVELWNSGLLWNHLIPSLTRLIVRAALGVAAGIGAGIAIGLFSRVRAGLVPLVAAIFPIPKIALPLFVIWFGIHEGSKYALIALGNVDRTLIRMAQSFGLSWQSIVRKIVLPGAMPGILSVLGVVVSALIGVLERRLLRWRV